MQIPRRRSPFRALIWKEWRQQRLILLLVAGLACALLILSLFIFKRSNAAREDLPGILAYMAGAIGIIGIAVLSANAFAGERDDNTDLFLEAIPCSRGRLFRVKLGFVLFLGLAELIPFGAAVLAYLGRQPDFNTTDVARNWGTDCLFFAVGMLVLATVPALIASFGGSVIATVLASIPIAAACMADIMLSPVELSRFLPVASKMGMELIAAFTVILMLGTIIAAAGRAWIRVERSWRRSLRTAVATWALLMAYVILPSAAGSFYVTCVASLGWFLKARSPIITAYPGVISPNGKYMIYSTGYDGWEGRTRAALLDVDSGRSQWMTRFHYSYVIPVQRIWSPSGNKLVLDEAGLGLWPSLPRDKAHFAYSYSVVDARSGEKQDFAELWPVLKTLHSGIHSMLMIGWYSEDVFAIWDGRDVLFAHVRNHSVQPCIMPRSSPHSTISPYRPFITDRGIFFDDNAELEHGQTKHRVLRFAPELSEAEILEMPVIPGLAMLASVSRDGCQLIINEGRKVQNYYSPILYYYANFDQYIVSLRDGIKLTLLATPEPGLERLIPLSWAVYGFLPDGHHVLLLNNEEIALFDLDSHAVRRIPLKQESEWKISNVELSPLGGFAIVLMMRGTGGMRWFVVDLRLGTFWEPKAPVSWLGEDRLLLEKGKMPSVINRDGTGERPLLAE